MGYINHGTVATRASHDLIVNRVGEQNEPFDRDEKTDMSRQKVMRLPSVMSLEMTYHPPIVSTSAPLVHMKTAVNRLPGATALSTLHSG